ncbi:hypothetical protein AK812_SmicGene9472 [Symbiodinium microadriaticum]|uniref:CDP-alcohol phosphatidyltransferase class-I family protein C22A12.08c n=1 Tax=Symbiodinium microadriaticum TaxID=2951 RepID=A0A1Q9EIE3_SYMMI|nr:hypothetical protein AK812_SmicGene9472 [Symbiodinium microadriaticum]CAE7853588.1 unnamed protein product [Symbiodinium sp. KB8]
MRVSRVVRAVQQRWGVIFDIDGVLIQGYKPIPGAAEALRALDDARVPYAFMTNGGGVLEAQKAADLAARLGRSEPFGANRMLLSHTPFRALADRFQDRRVLVVGASRTAEVAASYGFDFASGLAVTTPQIASGTPEICPFPPLATSALPGVNVNAPDAPAIEAVLIFYEPNDWGTELQVITDAVAGGRPMGSGDKQVAEVWASNADFLWRAGYPVSRLGNGAFLESLKAVWRRRSGHDLQIQECGKPHKVQFDAAEAMLAEVAGVSTSSFSRIYMIGDNPAADIRGANAAQGPWRSILVRTGVYQGPSHFTGDAAEAPWRLEPDVHEAVRRLLAESHGEP